MGEFAYSSQRSRDETTGLLADYLQQAVKIVSRAAKPKQALPRLLALMTTAVDATSASIARWNPDTFLSTVWAVHFAADATAVECVLEPGLIYAPPITLQAETEDQFLAAPAVWHADDQNLPDFVRVYLQQSAIRTLLCLPLVVGGRHWGHVELRNTRQKRPLTPVDVALCQSVAQQGVLLLENRQLADSEAQRRREAEAMQQVTDELSGTLELDKVMQRAVEVVRGYLSGIHHCAISILERDDTRLRTLAMWTAADVGDEVPVDEFVHTKDSYAGEIVLTTKRPFAISDLHLHPFTNAWMQRMRRRGVRALLCIPLLVHSTPIGVLQILVWRQPRRFTDEEVTVCQSIANQAALAVENARLFEAEKRQLHLAQTLQKVGALLTSSLTPKQVYNRIFDLLAQVVEYDSVSLHLLDKESNQLYLSAHRGDVGTPEVLQLIQEQADQLIQRVQRPLQWAIISDTRTDPRWIPVAGLEYIRSWIGAALMVKGQLIGILNVDSHRPNAYDAEVGEMVSAFANQAAIAIENARLHREIQLQAEELTILHEVALATAVTMDVDELLYRTTDLIAAKLYPHSFGFILFDNSDKSLWPHASYHGVTTEKFEEDLPLTGSVAGKVIQEGEPIIIDDVREEPRYYESTPSMLSEVTVPLKVQQMVIGVINAESPELGAFSQRDVHFLSTLAGQVSTAVERANLYHAVRRQATNLARQVADRTFELRQERDRTLAILESAGEGILLTDVDARILYANPAMEKQTGYQREELINQKTKLFSSEQTPQATIADLWDTVFRGEPWAGEMVNRRKDGTLYDVSVVVTPLRDRKTEELSGFVSVHSDITRLKELDRLKSEFVSTVTHELRTPLTNIKTYLSLLERGRPEKRPYYLQVLNDETERLTRLIQDLLDLSRLEMAATRVEAAQADFAAQMTAVLAECRPLARKKEITLTDDLPDDLPLVFMTDDHLQQVLSNLLMNALSYTPAGGHVSIRVEEEERNIWCHIADDGPGIPSPEMERIFERFYRGSVALDEGVPGTGLGLSITKMIVERYEGAIAVESESGKGSRFSIRLQTAN